MTASNGSSSSSNGHSPENAATFLKGIEFGRLQERMALLTELQQAHQEMIDRHTRALILIMDSLTPILRHFATPPPTPTTSSSTKTKAATATRTWTPSPLIKRLVKHFTPDIAVFLLTRILKYGVPAVLTAGGAMSAWFKWLEPLLRALIG